MSNSLSNLRKIPKFLTSSGREQLFQEIIQQRTEEKWEDPIYWNDHVQQLQKSIGQMIRDENYYNRQRDHLINDIYKPQERLSFTQRNKLFIDSAIWRSVVLKVSMEENRNGIDIASRFVRKCVKEHLDPCPNTALHRTQLETDGETSPCRECPESLTIKGEKTLLPLGQEECGEEYQTETKRCNECGFPTRRPKIQHKQTLRKWQRGYVNRLNQTLESVNFQETIDKHKHDNGFVLLNPIYMLENDLTIKMIPETIEIIRGDPTKIRPIVSIDATLGSKFFTCVKHRNVFNMVAVEDLATGYVDQTFCTEKLDTEDINCGWPLQQVEYVILEREMATEVEYCFIAGEVFHEKQYSPATPMGVSPGDSLFYHITGLIGQERWIAEYYLQRKMFKGILFMPPNMGTGESVQQMMQQHFVNLRENQNYIPIIGIPKDGKAQYLRIDDTPAELQTVESREELRREIANFYGVMNAWMSDTSTGSGLNNQGMDMAIMNRFIDWAQTVGNVQKLMPLSAALIRCNIDELEYYYQYFQSEEQDLMAEKQRTAQDIANARAHQELGGLVFMNVDGTYTLSPKIEGQPLMPQQAEGGPEGMNGGSNGFGADPKETKPYQKVEGTNEEGQPYNRARATMPFQGSPQQPGVGGSGLTIKGFDGFQMQKMDGSMFEFIKPMLYDAKGFPIRMFKMTRQKDESGVSGTGHVVSGIVFEDGTTVIRWVTESPSITIFNSFEDFYNVHVGAHPDNDTIIEEVESPDDIFKYGGNGKHLKKEQKKAPEGGVTIQGKFYPGGQWIPKEVMENLSEEDRKKLEGGGKPPKGGETKETKPKTEREKHFEQEAKEDPETHQLVDNIISNRTWSKGTYQETIESEEFKQWFGDSKVVDRDGNPKETGAIDYDSDEGQPIVVFHGTTHEFNEFTLRNANPENDMGRGFYFTDGYHDVARNYKGEGPDLTGRIDRHVDDFLNSIYDMGMDEAYRLAEKHGIQGEPETDEWFDDVARADAKQKWVGDIKDGKVLEVFLKMENPAVIDLDNPRKGSIEVFKEMTEEDLSDWGVEPRENYDTEWEYDDAVSEATWNFVDDPDNNLLLSALDRALDELDRDFELDYDNDIMRAGGLFEALDISYEDDTTPTLLYNKFKELGAEHFDALTDSREGRYLGSELMSLVFQELGFDGVIYNDASKHFKNMGITPGTRHYVTWKPPNVKHISSQNFDSTSPNIYKQNRAPKGGATLQGKFYPGGQFIPKEVMESLSDKEKEKLEDKPKPKKRDLESYRRGAKISVGRKLANLKRTMEETHAKLDDLDLDKKEIQDQYVKLYNKNAFREIRKLGLDDKLEKIGKESVELYKKGTELINQEGLLKRMRENPDFVLADKLAELDPKIKDAQHTISLASYADDQLHAIQNEIDRTREEYQEGVKSDDPFYDSPNWEEHMKRKAESLKRRYKVFEDAKRDEKRAKKYLEKHKDQYEVLKTLSVRKDGDLWGYYNNNEMKYQAKSAGQHHDWVVNKNRKEIRKLFNEELKWSMERLGVSPDSLPSKGIKIRLLSRSPKKLGDASFTNGEIRLFLPVIAKYTQDDKQQLQETIRHEIAHILHKTQIVPNYWKAKEKLEEIHKKRVELYHQHGKKYSDRFLSERNKLWEDMEGDKWREIVAHSTRRINESYHESRGDDKWEEGHGTGWQETMEVLYGVPPIHRRAGGSRIPLG
jgi:hypothetical protein